MATGALRPGQQTASISLTVTHVQVVDHATPLKFEDPASTATSKMLPIPRQRAARRFTPYIFSIHVLSAHSETTCIINRTSHYDGECITDCHEKLQVV